MLPCGPLLPHKRPDRFPRQRHAGTQSSVCPAASVFALWLGAATMLVCAYPMPAFTQSRRRHGATWTATAALRPHPGHILRSRHRPQERLRTRPGERPGPTGGPARGSACAASGVASGEVLLVPRQVGVIRSGGGSRCKRTRRRQSPEGAGLAGPGPGRTECLLGRTRRPERRLRKGGLDRPAPRVVLRPQGRELRQRWRTGGLNRPASPRPASPRLAPPARRAPSAEARTRKKMVTGWIRLSRPIPPMRQAASAGARRLLKARGPGRHRRF